MKEALESSCSVKSVLPQNRKKSVSSTLKKITRLFVVVVTIDFLSRKKLTVHFFEPSQLSRCIAIKDGRQFAKKVH